MALEIDCAFDGGNIELVALTADGADLEIRKDSNGAWFQWFYFRVRGAAGRALTLRIVNAGVSSYPDGWHGYRACVSADRARWRRTDTHYADGTLEIRHSAQADEIWFAFFAPYDLARHRLFVARAAANQAVAVRAIGRSVDGRDIDCLSLGDGPRQVWLVGRQHSGETMASWWMEGALERLLDSADPVGAQLRAMARIHLVPIVNIDGAARGNLRGNAAGIDLNRQWHAPDPATAPEVAAVLAAMDETGMDLCLDVHGDETIPHVFIDGCDADPMATPAQVAGVATFKAALVKASPAFQTAVGYPVTYGGDGAPGMCCRAVARRYGGIGMTLEMPFKDSLEAPDPALGWSPKASARMGRDCLEAVLAVLEGYAVSRTTDTAKIGTAAPTDAVAISHIVNSAYRGPPIEGAWTSEFGILDGARVDVPAIERMIAAEGTVVLVLRDDGGAIAGCIAVEFHEETLSYLSMLSVDPCRQAKGLGRQLVAAAERYARSQGATRARVTVIHVRLALIDWYLRQDYKPTGETEPFPYGDDTVGVPLRDDLQFIVLEKLLR